MIHVARRRIGAVAAVIAALGSLLAATPPATAALEAPRPPLLQTTSRPLTSPPAVTAAAWALVDARSGQVLDGVGLDELRPVASTVKLLTALTVTERASLTDAVVVSEAVRDVGGAGTSVDPGESWTVQQLLEALLVRSGNDAATALAVHVGGSLEGFVELMRQDAAILGLDPILTTPTGLDDRNRLTARDLAVIARTFLADDGLRAIAARRTVRLPDIGTVPSRNLLLDQYPDATGLKTGFTTASGYSLVGSAERDGRTLIAVVLGAAGEQERFDDAGALLDWGFAWFEEVRVSRSVRLREGGRWVTVGSDPAWVTVPTGTEVHVDWTLPRRADAAGPVEVRIPRTEPILLDVRAAEPPRSPTIATWLRDRVHEALRTAAARGT